MKANNSIFKTFFLSLCIIANTHFAYGQTASILPPAKTTFVDLNGKPLTSGTVDFYIPSTTTRKTTWKDAGETVPNTNPVVLDSAGRALILGSGNYRQVVKDRVGNLIWDQVTSSTGSGGSAPTATGDGDLVGTIKPWAGMTAPNQYMFTYGQEVSRITYAALFTAITSTQATFCTPSSPIITGLSDTTNFWVGMPVEISCVVTGVSTIVSKTASTVTLSANSNVNSSTVATFFPWGNGNSSTTFNLPDFRGFAIAGNNNMGGVASSTLTTTYFGVANPNSTGGPGGSQFATLATANLPPQTPSGTIVVTNGAITTSPASVLNTAGSIVNSGGTGGAGAATSTSASQATSTATFTGTTFAGQTSTPVSVVQPTKTSNYIIKVTPDVNSASASGVTDINGMVGSIGCGAGLVCTGNVIDTAPGTGTYIGIGAGSSNARIPQNKMRDIFSVLDYSISTGCVADNTSDCAPAINAAIAAAAAYTNSASPGAFAGAKVYLPSGPSCYRIASSINMLRHVSLTGDAGKGSCIRADNVNAIVYSYTSGDGNDILEKLTIVGVNASAARIAISRVPTAPTNSDDSMFGLTIRDVVIDNFDTAISLFTAITVTIDNVRISDVNQGILWKGFGGAAAIKNSKIYKLLGGGTGGGTFTGIDFTPATYTSGATPGTLGPEGVVIDNETSINGFAIGVNYQLGNYFVINNSDITATNTGIKFAANADGLSILNNYIVMKTSSAVAGIYGTGVAAIPNTITNIKNNQILSDGTTTVVDGIRINDVGTSKQDNVTIESNRIFGINGYDIAFYNPGGKNKIIDNRCKSTGNTGSILVGTIQNGMTIVKGNICDNTITYSTSSDLTNGLIRRADNIASGTTPETPSWNLQSAVAPFFTVAGPTAARIYTFPDATDTIGALGQNQTWSGTNTHSGQITSTFGTPTIASGACGATTNGTVSGVNQSGIVTIGAAATTTCTISFSTTIIAPKACVIFPGNATAAVQGTTVARVGTPSTTAWVITGSVLANTVYSYICL